MPNFDKNDIEKCMENFKIIIENSNDLPNVSENIIELAINGGLGENCLRGIAWKILLKYYSIDSESSIKTWIDQTKEKRKLYHKKLKELTSLKKFSGDPKEKTEEEIKEKTKEKENENEEDKESIKRKDDNAKEVIKEGEDVFEEEIEKKKEIKNSRGC